MWRAVGLVVLAGAFVAAFVPARASTARPAVGGPPPVQPLPVQQYTVDLGQAFTVTDWRSDRIAGVVRERLAFHFCSSLSAGPFALAMRESIGLNANFIGYKFVQTHRFRLWAPPRHLVRIPECWNVSYSWQPKRVMVLALGEHELDATLRYPVSAGHNGLLPPPPLTDQEFAFR